MKPSESSPIYSKQSCHQSSNVKYTLQQTEYKLGDWLQAGGPGFNVQEKQEFFFYLYHFKTGTEAHPASHPMGTRSSSPGGKSAGA